MKFYTLTKNKLVISLAVALLLVLAGVMYQSVFGESDAAGLAQEDTDRAATESGGVTVNAGSGAAAFLGPNTIADIAEKAKKSVVTIEVTPIVTQRSTGYGSRTDPFFDPFLYFFFGFDPFSGESYEYYAPTSGTGFVISEDGYILTNNHVIAAKGDSKITVTLSDGTVCDATVVRSMTNPDVAVLKIDSKDKDLVPLPLGDSSKVRPGDWAIAIGNPLNMGITVTAGFISATHRGDDPRLADMFRNIPIPPEGFIQTDAAINPGNSGGPLLNLNGEVIGINTAMVMDGENVGFAIPINAVAKLLPQLMTEPKGGYLGVELRELDSEYARRLGIDGGVVVFRVFDGYPAEKAGLRRWDIILKIDGREVTSADDVRFEISSRAPGEEVEITFLRDNTVKVVTVTLAEAPSE